MSSINRINLQIVGYIPLQNSGVLCEVLYKTENKPWITLGFTWELFCDNRACAHALLCMSEAKSRGCLLIGRIYRAHRFFQYEK